MSRTIVVIALIGLAFWVLQKLWRKHGIETSKTPDPVFEKTVRCARCGVHVSVELAQQRDGKHYCCLEHLPRD